MTVNDELKWYHIVLLLIILQFRLVSNAGNTETKALRNFDGYDGHKNQEGYVSVGDYGRRSRSPSDDSDYEDVLDDEENVDNESKHEKAEKAKDDDQVKEKKLSEALTSEDKRKPGGHGDAVGNPCVTSPCAHGGTCTWNRDGEPGFRCDCRLGFHGRRCEREIEQCESLPCKERGDCVATAKGFLCLCKDGYGGRFCEVNQKTHSLVPESNRHDNTDGMTITRDTLQTVYVTIGVVGTLVAVIVFSLCIHSCRVWNQRLKHTEECKIIIENGGSVSELPPDVCEISNALCREFWCCSCIDLQGETNQYKELLGEFRTEDAHPNSPFPEMHYPQRLIQSEGALPNAHGSYRSFRSLPPKLKSFTKRPPWLPDVELSNDEDYMDSVNRYSPSRTRPRKSSPSRKSFRTCRDLPIQMAHDGILSEDSLERMEVIDSSHRRTTDSSGERSSTHHPYSPSRSKRQSPHNPPYHPNRSTHDSPNQHSSQSVFDKRASVRNILAQMAETQPPLPHLPSDQSVSSSTFS